MLILTNKQSINVDSLIISGPTFLFFSIILLVTALNHFLSSSSFIDTAGLIWGIINIILMLGFYLIAKKINIQSGSLFSTSIVFVYFIFIIFTVIFYSEINQTIILPTEMAANKDNVASYQSMAMCVLYTSIMMCPFINSRALKTFLLLSSVGLLYLVGSRTEFFLLASIIPVYIYIQYGVLVFTIFGVLTVPIAMLAAATLDLSGRFANIFSELQPGGARYELLAKGLDGIANNPIIGDYLGQVRDYGSPDAYIHNIFSVYQQYGLFAFLIYFYLTVASLTIGLRFLRFARHSVHVEILIYSSIVSIIGVLISKSLGWPLPAFAWGMSCVVLTMMARRQDKVLRERKLSALNQVESLLDVALADHARPQQDVKPAAIQNGY
jgi:hypothetical protein